MAVKEISRRRRVKKNIESGVTHIRPTFNNTIVMITDTHSNALTWSPVGSLGLKGSRRSTPLTTQMVVEVVTGVAMEHGFKTVNVTVKGPGSGCEAAIHSLRATGLEATAVRDVTPILHNRCRPPKRRCV